MRRSPSIPLATRLTTPAHLASLLQCRFLRLASAFQPFHSSDDRVDRLTFSEMVFLVHRFGDRVITFIVQLDELVNASLVDSDGIWKLNGPIPQT